MNPNLMSIDELSQAVIDLLAQHLKQEPQGWNADTVLTEIGIDSFDFVEFVFTVEDQFGIEIDYNANDMSKSLSTVGAVAAAIKTIAARRAPSEDAGPAAGGLPRGEAQPA